MKVISNKKFDSLCENYESKIKEWADEYQKLSEKDVQLADELVNSNVAINNLMQENDKLEKENKELKKQLEKYKSQLEIYSKDNQSLIEEYIFGDKKGE